MNVYCITFPNQKMYVGVESKDGSRRYAHSRSAFRKRKTLVAKAITKYGWEKCNFKYVVKNRNSDFCYELEKFIIKEYKLQNILFGYNQSSGGERGFAGVKMSQEHKNKIGEKHKNKKVSNETRQKLSNSLKGKKLSEERKKQMSISQKGKKSPMAGKKHSLESKAKISASIMGSKNPFYGKKHEQKTKDAVAASNRRRAKIAN